MTCAYCSPNGAIIMATKKHLFHAHRDNESLESPRDTESLATKRSANEEDDDAHSSDKSHQKRQRTEEEKKNDRVMANRKSAKNSRERRKALMETLKSTAVQLTEENSALNHARDTLKREMTLLQERRRRNLSQGEGCASAAKPFAPTAKQPAHQITLADMIVSSPLSMDSTQRTQHQPHDPLRHNFISRYPTFSAGTGSNDFLLKAYGLEPMLAANSLPERPNFDAAYSSAAASRQDLRKEVEKHKPCD